MVRAAETGAVLVIDERAVDHGAVLVTDGRAARVGAVARRALPIVVLALALTAAYAVRRQAPWIPWMYLLGLIALATAPWLLVRWRTGPRRWRTGGSVGAVAILFALLPVPWMTAAVADPPGTAWRLDGRLAVDGRTMDPPGAWYWLTVGRPPLVAEVVHGWLTGTPAPTSLREGSAANRPRFNEPAAAAVGLRAAGHHVVADDLSAVIGGRLAGTPAGKWFRGLALGRSHGLMVALVTYAHTSGHDLAQGRAIAGTGTIADDGSVSRIGGLRAKAIAAARAGADVLLFPADQAHELEEFAGGRMRLVPVATLAEAIDALAAPGL